MTTIMSNRIWVHWREYVCVCLWHPHHTAAVSRPCSWERRERECARIRYTGYPSTPVIGIANLPSYAYFTVMRAISPLEAAYWPVSPSGVLRHTFPSYCIRTCLKYARGKRRRNGECIPGLLIHRMRIILRHLHRGINLHPWEWVYR